MKSIHYQSNVQHKMGSTLYRSYKESDMFEGQTSVNLAVGLTEITEDFDY